MANKKDFENLKFIQALYLEAPASVVDDFKERMWPWIESFAGERASEIIEYMTKRTKKLLKDLKDSEFKDIEAENIYLGKLNILTELKNKMEKI